MSADRFLRVGQILKAFDDLRELRSITHGYTVFALDKRNFATGRVEGQHGNALFPHCAWKFFERFVEPKLAVLVGVAGNGLINAGPLGMAARKFVQL